MFRKINLNNNFILGFLSLTVFLIAWEVIVNAGVIKPIFISSPLRIAKASLALFKEGTIWKDMLVSGQEFVLGFGLAIVIGIPLGVLLGWYKLFYSLLNPFIAALYATPRIALLPVIVIWLGSGLWSKVAIILLGAIFPILVNTFTGVRSVDVSLIRAAKSFGAKERQIFTTVILPGSVPFILAGLRLGLGHSLIGIVVGEMYAASAGIGFLIAVSGATFQTDHLFVGVIIISMTGLLLTNLMERIEHRFDSWRLDR